MTGGETRWRGTSSGERADERRDRLLNVCEDIVAAGGAAALGVRAVCRAAGISPRHFYESFTDTDALLLAAYERAVQRLLDHVAAAITARGQRDAVLPMPARDRLKTAFDAATTYLQDHPQSGHIIFREALTNGVLRTRAALTLPSFVNTVGRMALPRPERTGQSRDNRLRAVVLSGGLAAAFLEWISGTADFTRDELVGYCTEASLALLSLDVAPNDTLTQTDDAR